MIPEILHIFRRGAICRLRHFSDIVEESTLSRAQLRVIQLAVRNCLYCLLICSLNPQEVSM